MSVTFLKDWFVILLYYIFVVPLYGYMMYFNIAEFCDVSKKKEKENNKCDSYFDFITAHRLRRFVFLFF